MTPPRITQTIRAARRQCEPVVLISGDAMLPEPRRAPRCDEDGLRRVDRRCNSAPAPRARTRRRQSSLQSVDPHFRYEADALDSLFDGLARTGVPSLYIEHNNLNAYIRTRLWWKMNTETPQIPSGLSNSGNRLSTGTPWWCTFHEQSMNAA